MALKKESTKNDGPPKQFDSGKKCKKQIGKADHNKKASCFDIALENCLSETF